MDKSRAKQDFRSTPQWAFLLLAFCSLMCLSVFAEETKSKEKPDPKPYQKEFVTGPLKAVLSLDRTQLRLDEDILLRLEVTAPEGYGVELPSLEAGLEQFKWDLKRSEGPSLQADGTLHQVRELVLEPLFVQEKMAVRPMTVRFTGKNEGGETKQYELETEEVPLEVAMPPQEYWEALDVTGAPEVMTRLEVPAWQAPVLWSCLALLVILLACWLVYVLRRRRKEELPPPVPPIEIAMEALRALVAENLVEKGDLMGFYNRIQDILRGYIEGQFQLRAPERTTEEFLAELHAMPHSPIACYDRQLARFLTHCDLVRFAAHQPENAEIQETFNACRDFLIATSQTEEEKNK